MRLFELPIYYKSREQLRDVRIPFGYAYNQIIGWVSIESRETSIRAEHWVTFQRPSRVLLRKEYEPKGKLFQISIKRLDNVQIFSRLRNALLDIQQNSYLRKYYLDLEAFDNVGPLIDWRKCVSMHNKSLNRTRAATARAG